MREPVVSESESVSAVEQKVEGIKRILVVEDDNEVRSMLVDSLKMLGYVVTEAHDGKTGLGRLHG